MKKKEEKEMIESIKKGEWIPVENLDSEITKLMNAAENLKIDARINIRISSVLYKYANRTN